MEAMEKDFLELCKEKIEEKYHLGNGDAKMKQRDFEYLIDLIEEASEIRLSISTLKRIWRNGGDQNPHPSTLNALVSILGYKDWLDFKLKNALGSAPSKFRVQRYGLFNKKVAIVFGIVVLLGIISAIYFNTGTDFPNAEDILFTANKTVSKGVPSTVIFNYDVAEIEADSFFIQQDWNPNHRDRIKPDGNVFSSIYYVPGFHKTKLVANDTFLKIIPVHIQTDGWMTAAFYNYDERPVYVPADRNQDGTLTAKKEEVLDSGVDSERFNELRFINIREFPGVNGHNFNAETRFRYRDFLYSPCPDIQLTIHTEVHIYYVQLTIKGCESNIAIKIGEVYQEGRDHDLSVFGADIYNWQELALQVENKTGTVLLNGNKVYEITFKEDFGAIVGLDFRSSGLSEIDFIRLKTIEGEFIYEEEFQEKLNN